MCSKAGNHFLRKRRKFACLYFIVYQIDNQHILSLSEVLIEQRTKNFKKRRWRFTKNFIVNPGSFCFYR